MTWIRGEEASQEALNLNLGEEVRACPPKHHEWLPATIVDVIESNRVGQVKLSWSFSWHSQCLEAVLPVADVTPVLELPVADATPEVKQPEADKETETSAATVDASNAGSNVVPTPLRRDGPKQNNDAWLKVGDIVRACPPGGEEPLPATIVDVIEETYISDVRLKWTFSWSPTGLEAVLPVAALQHKDFQPPEEVFKKIMADIAEKKLVEKIEAVEQAITSAPEAGKDLLKDMLGKELTKLQAEKTRQEEVEKKKDSKESEMEDEKLKEVDKKEDEKLVDAAVALLEDEQEDGGVEEDEKVQESPKASHWDTCWERLTQQGWTIAYGPREVKYYMPPGVKRGPGASCRKDYFDSKSQVLRHIDLQEEDGKEHQRVDEKEDEKLEESETPMVDDVEGKEMRVADENEMNMEKTVEKEATRKKKPARPPLKSKPADEKQLSETQMVDEMNMEKTIEKGATPTKKAVRLPLKSKTADENQLKENETQMMEDAEGKELRIAEENEMDMEKTIEKGATLKKKLARQTSFSLKPNNDGNPNKAGFGRSAKERLAADLACRWWYVLPDWPVHPEDFYKGELEKRSLRRVEIADWEFAPEMDRKGCKKVFELGQFKGCFRDSSGDLYDLRDKTDCPSYTNFMKKNETELCNLLIASYDNQIEVLAKSRWADPAIEEELRNRQAVVRAFSNGPATKKRKVKQ